MGLSRSTPNEVLDLIFVNSQKTALEMENKNNKKLNRRFNLKLELKNPISFQQEKKDLSLIPNNFIKLFYFSEQLCKCCMKNLTLKNILEHRNNGMTI